MIILRFIILFFIKTAFKNNVVFYIISKLFNLFIILLNILKLKVLKFLKFLLFIFKRYLSFSTIGSNKVIIVLKWLITFIKTLKLA